MKLHYSQTKFNNLLHKLGFQYLMKLHYSQTVIYESVKQKIVSVPYEITLLSNMYQCLKIKKFCFSTL